MTPDFLICLEDGKKFKSLKRHLGTHYELTTDQYRAKWGLRADYPMVAPNYSAARSRMACASARGSSKRRARYGIGALGPGCGSPMAETSRTMGRPVAAICYFPRRLL